MGTIKAVVGILAVVGVVIACFQVAPPLLRNYSFQDDLRNVAMMAGANPQRTDQDIRNDVIKRALDHDIQLDPARVTVQRIGTPGAPAVFVAADYTETVNLPGYSFDMHFTPSSGNKGF